MIEPNPTIGSFSVSAADMQAIQRLEIYTTTGQKVYSSEENAVNCRVVVEFEPGVYLVSGRMVDGATRIARVVIE